MNFMVLLALGRTLSTTVMSPTAIIPSGVRRLLKKRNARGEKRSVTYSRTMLFQSVNGGMVVLSLQMKRFSLLEYLIPPSSKVSFTPLR